MFEELISYKKIISSVGKCECRGMLTGSNQGIMAIDFGLEVSFRS